MRTFNMREFIIYSTELSIKQGLVFVYRFTTCGFSVKVTHYIPFSSCSDKSDFDCSSCTYHNRKIKPSLNPSLSLTIYPSSTLIRSIPVTFSLLIVSRQIRSYICGCN
ncbi:uncharacterized protein LOC143177579 [Calliopsis andreniformis]|uniref:uncharacterized protein LOC143177579 n=1 Tax=Calliopsis andreniformis TaxID=337506 RepID=UPI003FCE887A